MSLYGRLSKNQRDNSRPVSTSELTRDELESVLHELLDEYELHLRSHVNSKRGESILLIGDSTDEQLAEEGA
jgi:hypothetical protein